MRGGGGGGIGRGAVELIGAGCSEVFGGAVGIERGAKLAAGGGGGTAFGFRFGASAGTEIAGGLGTSDGVATGTADFGGLAGSDAFGAAARDAGADAGNDAALLAAGGALLRGRAKRAAMLGARGTAGTLTGRSDVGAADGRVSGAFGEIDIASSNIESALSISSS